MRPPGRKHNRGAQLHKARGMMGMTMGCVYILVAGVLVYLHREGRISLGDDVLTYSIITLMAAYGIFRIFRGWKLYHE